MGADRLSVLVTALGVAAALVAYRAERRAVYAAAKGVASLGFLATALSAGALEVGWARVAFAALVLSGAGDVALGLRGRGAFVAGLIAFSLAHLAYTAAFLARGADAGSLAWTTALAAILAAGAWLAFARRLPPFLRVPGGMYLLILAAMLATGTAAGRTHGVAGLAAGVVLVAGSDVAVARERFGTSSFTNKWVGLPAYYLGQTLIAASLGGM